MKSQLNISLELFDTDAHFDQENIRSTVDKIIPTLSDSNTVQSSIFDVFMPIPGALEPMTEYEENLVDEWIKNPPTLDQSMNFNQQNDEIAFDWDNIAETVLREVENIPDHITNQNMLSTKPLDKNDFDLLEMKRCRQENSLREINLNNL